MAMLNNVKVTASQIEVNGIKFTQTDDSAVIGDIIRFDDNNGFVTTGAYYEVAYIDGHDDPQITDDDGDEYDLCGDEFTVFKKTSVSSSRPARLGVGDFAKVVANNDGHSAKIGDIVKIVEDDESDLPFRCTNADGSNIGDAWFGPDELERVEVPAATVTASDPTSASDIVTHEGVQYRKVARKASIGDVVVVVANSGHILRNGVIVKIERGPSALGNMAAITSGTWMEDSDYNVLEPLETATPEPSYREVKRQANVGDRIKIVAAALTFGKYENGDEFIVTDADYLSAGRGVNVDGGGVIIFHEEYVVLEPITAVETVKTPEPLKVGDYVKYVNGDGCAVKGAILKIAEDDGGMIPYSLVNDADGFVTWALKSDVVAATDAEVAEAKRKSTPEPLKVGDYVKITVNVHGHSVGTIGKVTLVKATNGHTNRVDVVANDTEYAERNVVLATPEEIAAATSPTAKPSPTFKVGDTVKLTIADGENPSWGFGNVENGDIGVIKRINGDNVTVDFPAQSSWIGLLTEFTPASAEDVTEREVAAKWSAIGRSTGEYKNGDVVRIKRSFSAAGVKEGDIETVNSLEDIGVRLVKLNPQGLNAWIDRKYVELVAPVESLFTK